MRITGLATGLDMDEIVSSTMKAYRIKIDQKTQSKDVVEIKQQLYRDIMSDASKFYDKYFDMTKSDNLLRSSNYTSVVYKSSSDAVTVIGNSEAKKDNYTVEVQKLATAAKAIVEKDKLSENSIININGQKFELTGKDEKERVKNLNDSLQKAGINVTARYSEMAGTNGPGMILESKILGENSTFTVGTESDQISVTNGENAIAIITNNTTGGVYEHKGNSNTVTVDGATFTFNEKTTIDNPVKITGTSDVKDIKNKLVDFINDYNTLIEKLNTLTLTKHNRNYSPLTADQKKEMSETEIKLWNEKVKEGQLYKDSNLTRITNSLKESMRTLMESSGLNLESIGIIPVKDYSGSKNGTFTIDEEKLTQALQENSEDVMNLFIKSAPSKEELDKLSPEDQVKRKNETGILYKLKDILYSEFKSSTSLLAKKAGIEGTSTFTNNELTKSISEYENKIKDMEKDFAKREQALYSKYATLETMMNKLNAQMSSLQSMFG